jgi:hypothetical protein
LGRIRQEFSRIRGAHFDRADIAPKSRWGCDFVPSAARFFAWKARWNGWNFRSEVGLVQQMRDRLSRR